MNELLTKYKKCMFDKMHACYEQMIILAEIDHLDESEEVNIDCALEKIMKYGTYEECVHALKHYIIYVLMHQLLGILA